MKYDYLIGTKINNIEVTEELMDKTISRLISFRRKREKNFEDSDAFIIETFITEEDVIRNLQSAANLKAKSPDTSVKFDDIRKMSLGLDSLEGYEETEKQFIQQRLYELSQDFNLEKSTDKFLAWRVAVCELKIMQLETLLVVNKKEAANIDAVKQIDLLDKQYKLFCESLNVLKRQRDNKKDKLKDSETNEFKNTIKSVDEMQAEVKQKQLEIKKKKEEKQKRNK